MFTYDIPSIILLVSYNWVNINDYFRHLSMEYNPSPLTYSTAFDKIMKTYVFSIYSKKILHYNTFI